MRCPDTRHGPGSSARVSITAAGAPGSNVFLQLIDPAAFGGTEAFRAETGFLAESCRAAAPLAGGPPVRVPGDRAHRAMAEQRQNGLALHPEISARLRPCLEKYALDPPVPIK